MKSTVKPTIDEDVPQVTRRTLVRWLNAGVFVTLLMAVSTTWQSWQRNATLSSLTSLPVYFFAIWLSLLLWIPIAILIFRLHQRMPMFSQQHSSWWLYHFCLSLMIGVTHQFVDTSLLWLSLSGSFTLWAGFAEKLIRWLPYELLAYWACLSIMTLITHRKRLLGSESPDKQVYLERIGLKIDGETHLIPIKQVEYLEAYDNYVQIWRDDNRQLIKETMTNLEKQLDPAQFMRVHRSFIINLNQVDRIGRNGNDQPVIITKRGRTIPISRRRKARLREILTNSH